MILESLANPEPFFRVRYGVLFRSKMTLEQQIASLFHSHLELLLEGPKSTIFKAHHKRFGAIAVKVTEKTNTTSIEREIEHLRACQGSEYVVSYISCVFASDYAAFSQELCELGDLFEYSQRYTISERSQSLCLFQIGKALDHIHRRAGIIHQDIKPENIGITRSGNIKILDFGCSTRATKSGVICCAGSVNYASPEKLQRKSCAFDVDWWSFGVLSFEVVFGYLPFFRESTMETVTEICTVDIKSFAPPLNTNFEQVAWQFIEKLLCLNLQSRVCIKTGFTDIEGDPFFSFKDHSTQITPFPPPLSST